MPSSERATTSRTAVAAQDLGSARVLVASSDQEDGPVAESVLTNHGYDVVSVGRASDVRPALENHAIDVIVLDGAIAEGSTSAIEAVRSERFYGDVPIIVVGTLTGDPRSQSLPGVDDQLPRPLDPHRLAERVRVALRARRSLLGMESAHAVAAALANELLTPQADVRLHTERLGTYTSQLGRRVGLSASDLNAVAYGTLLHDLAKLGISEWVLLKPGHYTEEDRIAMQRHTEIGERIAAPLAASERLGPILRHHHEHWDGSGYPDGLRGEAIPMGARIIGIVDAFDAMTQHRPYRQPMSVPEAVDELQVGAGSQFDPGLVEAFIEVLRWDGLI
jgi:putative two-component system response regulator